MREMRYKFTGTLFYIIIILNLLLTSKGIGLVRNITAGANAVPYKDIIITFISLGALLFTSDAIGYIFGAIVVFWFENITRRYKCGFLGYSNEWHKVVTILKKEITEKCNEPWKDYRPDVFLNYFWQKAPRPLIEWVVRRDTAFLTGMTAAAGVGFGCLLSSIAILKFGMGWWSANYVILIISFISVVLFWLNARYSHTDGWQMVYLWLSGELDDKMRIILQEFSEKIKQSKINDKESERDQA